MVTQAPTLLCLLLLAGALPLGRAEDFPQCANVEPETFVMAVEDCASYIYCNGEDSFRDSCPDNTYFDDRAQECAFDDAGFCLRESIAPHEEVEMEAAEPEPGAIAPEEGLPTTTATTAAPVSGTTPAAVARPHCDSSSDSFHPHPQRCEYYYRCLSGYLTIVRCPYNYGWDHPKEQCQPLAEAQCYSHSS